MSAIAREAGALLMEYFDQNIKIEYKGEADLVTAADRKSETLIRDRIRAKWPGHDVLGEEEGLHDTGSAYRWYVDPLDGTTNFAHGFPVFCVSMALQHNNETIAGVCYDPTRNEMFAAELGKGAYLNERPIHVSKTVGLAESLVATGFPSHKQYSLLSSDHIANSWRAARWISRLGSLLRRLWTTRRLLGIQPQSLGHSRWRSHCARGWWSSDGLPGWTVSIEQPRNACVEWANSRCAAARVPGDFCRTRTGPVAGSAGIRSQDQGLRHLS